MLLWVIFGVIMIYNGFDKFVDVEGFVFYVVFEILGFLFLMFLIYCAVYI